MKVQDVAIDKIIPYSRNPRIGGAIQKVAASIKEFGFQQPIVVDGEMVVIAGHTRLEAARMLGLSKVPVVIATDLDPIKVKAYRIADNRTAVDAKWDGELLGLELAELKSLSYGLPVLGFEEAELDEYLVPANGRDPFTPATPVLDDHVVTDNGIAKAADELDEAYRKAAEQEIVEIGCPHCGQVFGVNKSMF